jgi:hypothetical protein
VDFFQLHIGEPKWLPLRASLCHSPSLVARSYIQRVILPAAERYALGLDRLVFVVRTGEQVCLPYQERSSMEPHLLNVR